MCVRVWRIDRSKILSQLKEWAKTLGENENVLAVILFGSFARGDELPSSDADILILLQSSPIPFHERIPYFIPSKVDIGVDVFPYTLKEARKAKREGWGVVNIALKEGVFLVGNKEELIL